MATLQCILLVCLGALVAQAINRVVRIGNPITPSSSGIDAPGTTFLINHLVHVDGVLFALRAYFRSDKPFWFQIWRPASNASSVGEFELISNTFVIPSLVDGEADIYLVDELLPCPVIHQEDRLGLSFIDSPGSVAYTFDASHPEAFVTFLDPTLSLDLYTIVKFDTLSFPYEFSIAAYVDTYLSNYNITPGVYSTECPTDLLIPDADIADELISVPPITGAPDTTSATDLQESDGSSETGTEGPAAEDGTGGQTVATGPGGETRVTATAGTIGSGGINSLDSVNGHQEPQVGPGPTSPPGPPSPAPPGPSNSDYQNALPTSNKDDFMSIDRWIYIFLAWLVLLTIFIVFIILYLVGARRHKNDTEENSDQQSLVDNEIHDEPTK